MQLNRCKRLLEEKFCKGKKLVCEPIAEVGENNLIPFQKVSWVCKCKSKGR